MLSRFRDTYRSLRLRYPDVPLFTMEDHLRVEQDMAKAFTRQMDAVIKAPFIFTHN